MAALTGAVGILIGVLALTGIGIRFSYVLVELAGGNLPLTLLLLAVVHAVLGLALPITATYLMVAVVAVPVLADLGLPLLTAHLIILWLALDANITPPVALGPFAAAAIAGADPMKTGWSCFRFAKSIYLMPVLFAYTHLLLTGTPSPESLGHRLGDSGDGAVLHLEHRVLRGPDDRAGVRALRAGDRAGVHPVPADDGGRHRDRHGPLLLAAETGRFAQPGCRRAGARLGTHRLVTTSTCCLPGVPPRAANHSH